MKLPELWEFSKLNSHDVGDDSLLQIAVKSIFEETLSNQLHNFLAENSDFHKSYTCNYPANIIIFVFF